MKPAILFVLLGLSGGCDKLISQPACPVGHMLWLDRQMGGIQTERACVVMDGDCAFIARILQKAEPEVIWFCR